MAKPIVAVSFTAKLQPVKDWVIMRLPAEVSEKMPSRGQVAVQGTINGHDFSTVLEPDGYWGHWLRITDQLQKLVTTKKDSIDITLSTTAEWPEPTIPEDIKTAIDDAPGKVRTKWHDITPMARWEWIRWVNSTGNTETRAVRIEKTIGKLNGKHRRPCCFNLAACTEPYVAKSARIILGPQQAD